MTDERLDFMKKIALEAGKIIMEYWPEDIRSSYFKDDKSVVTQADLVVRDFLMEQLAIHSPDDGLLTEETYEQDKNYGGRLSKQGVYIFDELDGSGDFMRKEPDFCFLGAYAENGVVTHGVVYEPLKERMFFVNESVDGSRVAWVKEKKNCTITLGRLKQVTWENSIVGHPKNYKGDKYTKLYELMGIPEHRLGRSGSMGTRMMQVALQETHMILGYTRSLKEWDIAAGHVILEARGISVTDIEGNPLRYNKQVPKTENGILVVHPDVKEVTLEKLAGCHDRLPM